MAAELLIFDLDGVLVESELILADILSERLRGIGVDIDAAGIVRRFHYRPFPIIVEILAGEHAVTVPDGFVEALPQVYAQAMEERLDVVKGAHEALAALPLPKCIASGSGPDNLRRKLEIVGLLPYFEPHLFSAFEVPRPKPAPDVFLHAARMLDTPPDRCLVIEDAVVGVQAAKAAGMHAIGFCGAGHCHEGWGDALAEAGADGVLDALSQLPDYVRRQGLVARS